MDFYTQVPGDSDEEEGAGAGAGVAASSNPFETPRRGRRADGGDQSPPPTKPLSIFDLATPTPLKERRKHWREEQEEQKKKNHALSVKRDMELKQRAEAHKRVAEAQARTGGRGFSEAQLTDDLLRAAEAAGHKAHAPVDLVENEIIRVTLACFETDGMEALVEKMHKAGSNWQDNVRTMFEVILSAWEGLDYAANWQLLQNRVQAIVPFQDRHDWVKKKGERTNVRALLGSTALSDGQVPALAAFELELDAMMREPHTGSNLGIVQCVLAAVQYVQLASTYTPGADQEREARERRVAAKRAAEGGDGSLREVKRVREERG